MHRQDFRKDRRGRGFGSSFPIFLHRKIKTKINKLNLNENQEKQKTI